MPAIHTLEQVLDLAGADTPVHPASDIKSGWSRIVESAMRHGKVIITHHRRPEVVVMGVAAYAAMVRRAEANRRLRVLRADIDRRFARLNTGAGSTRFRKASAAGIARPSKDRAAQNAKRTTKR